MTVTMKAKRQRFLSIFGVATGILAFLSIGIQAKSAVPAEVEIYTEELPPLNYTENSKIVGSATEVVQAVLDEIGVKGHFNSVPWARAMRMAQSSPNVLIYSIVKNKEREPLFKWVGKIIDEDTYLYCLKTKNINISSLDDAKKFRIGTIIRDFHEDYFIQHGFGQGQNIESVASNDLNYAKLKAERIDLWPVSQAEMNYFVRKAGDDPHRMVKPVFKITDFEVEPVNYMAFGLQTGDDVVTLFRNGLEKIKADGTYAAIMRKWHE